MNFNKSILPLVILVFSFFGQVCFADVPLGYESFTDWLGWAELRRGVSARLASSYDRTGGNRDYSYYESPEGALIDPQPVTVKTIDGPGIIYRFWMPHCMAKRRFEVEMYFDGEQTPRIDTDSEQIMEGNYGYFAEPFINTVAGGQVCYEPIPFQNSLRIESYNKDVDASWYNHHYYQYSYTLLPENTDIDSYSPELSEDKNQLRTQSADILSNPGSHPAGQSQTSITRDTDSAAIEPGGELVLADIDEQGVIRKLVIEMSSANDTELENVNLRVCYDGKAEPAIDVPVGLFFGAGKGRAEYSSLVMGTVPSASADANEGFYCYLPMPFRESVKVSLYNTLAEPVDVNSAIVEYEPGEFDNDLCYLHAEVNTTVRDSGQTYHNIVSAEGCGHYIGSLLYCRQDANSFRMLEGDDYITVDGEVVQQGTGLEDAYNGGAYYNWVAVQEDEPEGVRPQSASRPLSGILYVHKEEGLARADQYRWRIPDCIPFFESIDVDVEIRYAKVEYNPEWTSVGFWYQYHCLRPDLNDDCIVNFEDFAEFIDYWLE